MNQLFFYTTETHFLRSKHEMKMNISAAQFYGFIFFCRMMRMGIMRKHERHARDPPEVKIDEIVKIKDCKKIY